MIQVFNIEPNLLGINSLSFVGDGTSTSLVLDLSKDPFNLTFSSPPAAVAMQVAEANGYTDTVTAAIATVSGVTSLTITFGSAPPVGDPFGSYMQLNITFLY
jgi:hypothetical protein